MRFERDETVPEKVRLCALCEDPLESVGMKWCRLCWVAQEDEIRDAEQHSFLYKMLHPAATWEHGRMNHERTDWRQAVIRREPKSEHHPRQEESFGVLLDLVTQEVAESISRELTTLQLDIAVLIAVHELTHREVAARLGISESTVRREIVKARLRAGG